MLLSTICFSFCHREDCRKSPSNCDGDDVEDGEEGILCDINPGMMGSCKGNGLCPDCMAGVFTPGVQGKRFSEPWAAFRLQVDGKSLFRAVVQNPGHIVTMRSFNGDLFECPHDRFALLGSAFVPFSGKGRIDFV